jgi:hypothetical protein
MKKYIPFFYVLLQILFSCDLENSSGILMPTELSSEEITENDSSSSDNTPSPAGALNRTIYLPVMDVYVARGEFNRENPHGTDVSEENILEILCGWGMNSINPIMLQMDIALLKENVTIHNVILAPSPANVFTDPGGPYDGWCYADWGDFTNDNFRGFDGRFGKLFFPECDITGKATNRDLEIDPVAHHVLFLEWGPTGGYTGGAKSGIANDVSGATRNVIAHEFGHMFGLGHNTTEDSRLMNPVIFDHDLFLNENEKRAVKAYINEHYLSPENFYPQSNYGSSIHKRMKARMKTTSVETGSLTLKNIASAEQMLNFRHYERSNLALTEMP